MLKMNINLLLFSLMLQPTELYLSRSHNIKLTKNKIKSSKTSNLDRMLNKNNIKTGTIDNEIEDTIEQINSSEREDVETPLKKDNNEDFMSKIVRYGTQAKETFKEIKSTLKNLYGAIVGYAKSNYVTGEKQERKNDPDCWQIGIDVSRTCYFIFFPKKPKKITGILIDKGILLDYINPAPVFCNF